MSTALILLSDFQKTEIELWKPVAGHDGYDVSNLGRVRSWRTVIGQGRNLPFRCGRREKPRLLRAHPKNNGRLQVRLSISNQPTTAQVHRLVAKAFILNPCCLPEVNHKTGVHTDNRAGNLEWVTPRQNYDHAVAYGLRPHGEGNTASKLKDVDIVRIRQRRDSGETCASISKDYPVSISIIAKIARRESWKHVSEHG